VPRRAPRSRPADEEVGVALGGRSHRFRLELLLRDVELAGVRAVKVHLVADRRLAEVGETTHGLEVGGARRSQREQALVLDQRLSHKQ
jgi:hypothetical protein